MGTSLDVLPTVAPGQDSVKMFRCLRKEIAMSPIRVAGLGALGFLTFGQAVMAETVTTMTNAYAQAISVETPGDFQAGFEKAQDGFYILELVPKGEAVENWTQLITLTALEGKTGGAQQYAQGIVGQFAQACPETFTVAELEPPEVTGARAVAAAFAACGDLGGYSESVVFITFDGAQDAYSLQWAEHGPAVAEPPAYDPSHWQVRFDLLSTALFSDR
jgi:hypothetical protein